MMLLAIDTTGPLASVAAGDGKEIKMLINRTEYSHLEELAPMTMRLLSEEGIKPEELSGICVSRGPGSFTGIRIGVVTAKALAQVWRLPVICVPTLESFAFAPWAKDYAVCPLFDARRSQVYAGCFTAQKTGEFPKALAAGGAYSIEDYLGLLEKVLPEGVTAAFCGDGCAPYKEALEKFQKPHVFIEGDSRFQTADNVLRYGALMYEKGMTGDCYTAEPDYMRESEAERKLKDGSLKKK